MIARKQSDATKLRHARTEVKNLRMLNEAMATELLERRRVGGMMSNLCFNLAQDSRLDERYRKSMDECRKEWDAILRVKDGWQ